jgi:hypothetical protein
MVYWMRLCGQDGGRPWWSAVRLQQSRQRLVGVERVRLGIILSALKAAGRRLLFTSAGLRSVSRRYGFLGRGPNNTRTLDLVVSEVRRRLDRTVPGAMSMDRGCRRTGRTAARIHLRMLSSPVALSM